MPTLIKLVDGAFVQEEAQRLFPTLAPTAADQAQEDEKAGVEAGAVLVRPEDKVEALAPHLSTLAIIALAFPKFRDGRPYSSAVLLRERMGFKGEIRAVGEVLRDQAFDMVRCGFTAFEPADGSDAAAWAEAAGRFRHVYQSAPDGRPPAYAERSAHHGL